MLRKNGVNLFSCHSTLYQEQPNCWYKVQTKYKIILFRTCSYWVVRWHFLNEPSKQYMGNFRQKVIFYHLKGHFILRIFLCPGPRVLFTSYRAFSLSPKEMEVLCLSLVVITYICPLLRSDSWCNFILMVLWGTGAKIRALNGGTLSVPPRSLLLPVLSRNHRRRKVNRAWETTMAASVSGSVVSPTAHHPHLHASKHTGGCVCPRDSGWSWVGPGQWWVRKLHRWF